MIDKNLLLSETLSKKLSEIMNMYFQLNRILDAGMDFLDVDMNMNKISNYIHLNFAHKAPIDADAFRDRNADNSYRTYYGNIESSDGNYTTPLAFFEYALEYILKIIDAISDGIDFAKSENDEETKQFLMNQFPNIGIYKKQFVLLCDKCEKAIQEGNTWQDIDNRWEDFKVV